MVSFTVTANLLLKTGVVNIQTELNLFRQLFSWRLIVGLFSYGMAACCYMLILRWLPLNVATSFAAVQYVAVILVSAWILYEPIDLVKWSGIILITVGICIIGWSQQ